ncbi:hypothetical protein KFL_000580180 [Klebsormidium nitens]|uniref:Helicase ATP-binding domain-containing protein n=1 Tax=Klebsormidium nitens TaxID=105231 RepID=A0A1Y1HPR1_KLENI|nr:hypothetical protein KFL_000580180 [Klebsormidium nitens]|eukprot:GAQ80624.1 hypothetical protein KFL_000580180 [Klebsormidium nitens]
MQSGSFQIQDRILRSCLTGGEEAEVKVGDKTGRLAKIAKVRGPANDTFVRSGERDVLSRDWWARLIAAEERANAAAGWGQERAPRVPGQVRTVDGTDQGAAATAWEQCAQIQRERAMREALAVGAPVDAETARTRAELRAAGPPLTKADARQSKQATGGQSQVSPKEPILNTKGNGKNVSKEMREKNAPESVGVGLERQILGARTSLEAPSGETFSKANLLPHQVEAFEFLKRRMVGDPEAGGKGRGAILWMSPGLGKTLVALALNEHLRHQERLLPLIVAPASIQDNWLLEIRKWFPGKPGKPRHLAVYRLDTSSVRRAAAQERREEEFRSRAERAERRARGSRLAARGTVFRHRNRHRNPRDGQELEGALPASDEFMIRVERPLEQWSARTGQNLERNAGAEPEPEAARVELTALFGPFLYYAGEGILHGALGVPPRNDFVYLRLKMNGKAQELQDCFRRQGPR